MGMGGLGGPGRGPGMAGMGPPGMGPGGPKPSLRKAFVVFQNRTYRFLWFSSTFSFLGMQMQMIAGGLLAWALTESFRDVGLVSMAMGLPMLVFSLLGGAIADRVDKRNLTIATQAAICFFAIGIALLIVTGLITIWWLVGMNLALGTAMSLGMPARQPLMVLVVGPQQMMSAMALSTASMNATRLVGPAAAGALAASVGIEAAYFAQAGFYVLSVALMFFVPSGLDAEALSAPRGGMVREIGRGLTYVSRSPRLRLLMLMAFIPALFAMPYMMLLPGFVQRDLGQTETAVGVLNSISGIGALVGSLLIASLTEYSRKPLLQVVSGVVGGLGLLMLGAASVAFGYPGAIAGVLVMGLALTMYQTLNMVTLMTEAEPEYYGRVMSIMMLTFSVMPLAAFPLGIVADRFGATNLFMVQGVLIAGAMLLVTLGNPRYIFSRVETPEGMPPPHGMPAGRPGFPTGGGPAPGTPPPGAGMTAPGATGPRPVAVPESFERRRVTAEAGRDAGSDGDGAA